MDWRYRPVPGGVVTTRTCNAVREAKDQETRKTEFGNLQFKGKVAGSMPARNTIWVSTLWV